MDFLRFSRIFTFFPELLSLGHFLYDRTQFYYLGLKSEHQKDACESQNAFYQPDACPSEDHWDVEGG